MNDKQVSVSSVIEDTNPPRPYTLHELFAIRDAFQVLVTYEIVNSEDELFSEVKQEIAKRIDGSNR